MSTSAKRLKPTLLELAGYAREHALAPFWPLPDTFEGTFDRAAYDDALEHWQDEQAARAARQASQ